MSMSGAHDESMSVAGGTAVSRDRMVRFPTAIGLVDPPQTPSATNYSESPLNGQTTYTTISVHTGILTFFSGSGDAMSRMQWPSRSPSFIVGVQHGRRENAALVRA